MKEMNEHKKTKRYDKAYKLAWKTVNDFTAHQRKEVWEVDEESWLW